MRTILKTLNLWIGKKSVDYSIWEWRTFDKISDEKILARLFNSPYSYDEKLSDYILRKFHKKKCPHCDGKGFVDEDQPL